MMGAICRGLSAWQDENIVAFVNNNDSQIEENILEVKEDSSLLNKENTGSKINSSKQKINENKDNQVIEESSKIKNKANNIENIESLIPPWIR